MLIGMIKYKICRNDLNKFDWYFSDSLLAQFWLKLGKITVDIEIPKIFTGKKQILLAKLNIVRLPLFKIEAIAVITI